MKIAVFYHCKLSGDGIPSSDLAVAVVAEQMAALKSSGLADAADEIHLCADGSDADCLLLAALGPSKSQIHANDKTSEWPTIHRLHQWAFDHPDWAVCYHHSKGVSNTSEVNARWRRCMERAVICQWQTCAASLRGTYDTAGAHWFRNLDQQYWAGNFWWSKSDYLKRLPEVSTKTVNGRSYESEVWIGKLKSAPQFLDLAPHYPMRDCR